MSSKMLLLTCFLAFSAMLVTHAVYYIVGDAPADVRHNTDIGLDYTKQTLSASADRKDVEAFNGYSGDVKTEITGVLYRESAHAPGGLVEGIADYVRLRAGYAPAHWVRCGTIILIALRAYAWLHFVRVVFSV